MNKIYSLLGLCYRAGKLVSGEVACEQSIRQKQVHVILVAEDASKNCKKKFADTGVYYKIPVFGLGTKEELGRAIGKEFRAVLAITDEGFAKKVRELLEKMDR